MASKQSNMSARETLLVLLGGFLGTVITSAIIRTAKKKKG